MKCPEKACVGDALQIDRWQVRKVRNAWRDTDASQDDGQIIWRQGRLAPAPWLRDAQVDRDVRGWNKTSDHAPVGIDLADADEKLQ